MSNTTYLLDRDDVQANRFSALHPQQLRDVEDIKRALSQATNRDTWIIRRGELAKELFSALIGKRWRFGKLLLLDQAQPGVIPPLMSYFDSVVLSTIPHAYLPAEEIAEILNAPNKQFLCIGGSIDHESETLTLWRGDFSSLVVPFSAFPPTATGTLPVFDDFSVADHGLTVKLGDYEAAVDAILYEYDPDYRRYLNNRRHDEDKSFGASLRRLRKQKELNRSDFSPLSPKTIARIERGEIQKPRAETLSSIAERLGVQPDEIDTY